MAGEKFIALEETSQEIKTAVQEVITSIGDTGDTGGSTVAGTVMAKLNNIQANTDGLDDNLAYLNSTIDSENPVALDILMTQLLYGTVFEYSKPGTYQLLIPANVNKIKVTACGGGGAGGGDIYHATNPRAGGGGGGAAIVDQEYTVTPQSTLNITVGAGGKGDTGINNTYAASGTATVIGNLVTLAGGQGGYQTTNQSADTGGAAGGAGGGKGGNAATNNSNTATAGENGISGTGGKVFAPQNGVDRSGGGGGGSIGNGGNGGYNTTSGSTSRGGNGNRGGGGGGCGCKGYSRDGSNGGNGYVKIELIITP